MGIIPEKYLTEVTRKVHRHFRKKEHGEVPARPMNGWLALSPLVLFLCVYLVSSIIASDFYKVPIAAAFLIASAYALLITRCGPAEQRIAIFSEGAGNKNVLLMIWIFVLAGAFAGTAEDRLGRLSYGGRTKYGRIITPDPMIPEPCDIFNGNLVLVPDFVYRRLGTLDRIYSHSFGDFDYGVRAAKKNLTAVVAPGVLAECDRNEALPKWRDPAFSLKVRYASIMGPKGRPFKEQFIYDFRAFGPVRAMLHFLSLNLKVLFPMRYK